MVNGHRQLILSNQHEMSDSGRAMDIYHWCIYISYMMCTVHHPIDWLIFLSDFSEPNILIFRFHLAMYTVLLSSVEWSKCSSYKIQRHTNRAKKWKLFCWIIRLFRSGIFHIDVFPFELLSLSTSLSLSLFLHTHTNYLSMCFFYFEEFFMNVYIVWFVESGAVTFLHQIMKSYYEWLCRRERERMRAQEGNME